MSRTLFFSKYALNRLRNGGQRVFIALLAVAFGVMSLITMVSVSDTLTLTLSNSPQVKIGGDLTLTRTEQNITPSDLAALDEALANGIISDYTPLHTNFSLLIRTPDSGQARFIQRGIGVDPSVYPLAGGLIISAPADASLPALIGETGTALITRDLALQYDIQIGDSLRAAQPSGLPAAIPLVITGIVSETPDQNGQRLYYSLETAQAMFGMSDAYYYVVANTADSERASAQFSATGWDVERADTLLEEQDTTGTLFDLMLRGAGVMGLIVGGIGIANTMQVLVAQRRHEVGILKTLGCSQRDMLFISIVEAGLLGLMGSILGALASWAVAGQIISLFANITSLLMVQAFSIPLMFGGIFIGVITTLIFAFYAIWQTSQIRPTVIFRQETSQLYGWGQRLKPLGFYAFLCIPFSGLTTLIMGSVVDGIGVILVALGGLAVFSLLLGVSSWVLLRVLPTMGRPLLTMARTNMRKRALSMLFAMIALFIGIFTLGFAATIIQVSVGEFDSRQDDTRPNLMIYVDSDTVPQVKALLTTQGITDISEQATDDAMINSNYAIYAMVDPAQEADIARLIGQTFPNTMTVTRADLNAEMNRTFTNLFGLAIAMASLALLAGLMLVANVVSLALIQRRYEIGVMKAVGYTRRHILILFGLEYGLMGFIASVIGVVGVQCAIFAITLMEGAAVGLLIMNPLTALVIVVMGVALTLITALVSAWKPSGIRPLQLLNKGVA